MRITDAILEQFGGPAKFTDGCPGCEHKRAGREGHRGHSAACRERIYEAMQNSEEGRDLLEENLERIARRAAEHGGGSVPRPAAAPEAAPREDDAGSQPAMTSPATPRFGREDRVPVVEEADVNNEPNRQDDEIPDLEDSDDEDDGDVVMSEDAEDGREKRPRRRPRQPTQRYEAAHAGACWIR